jgi:hypothetical protein
LTNSHVERGFSAACVAVSPGTSQTGTPQILVFSGSKRALLQLKNADCALIFTEEWRRVGSRNIGFSFCFNVFSTIKGICADHLMKIYKLEFYISFIYR